MQSQPLEYSSGCEKWWTVWKTWAKIQLFAENMLQHGLMGNERQLWFITASTIKSLHKNQNKHLSFALTWSRAVCFYHPWFHFYQCNFPFFFFSGLTTTDWGSFKCTQHVFLLPVLLFLHLFGFFCFATPVISPTSPTYLPLFFSTVPLFMILYSLHLFPSSQCDCGASAGWFVLRRVWVLGWRGGVEEVRVEDSWDNTEAAFESSLILWNC